MHVRDYANLRSAGWTDADLRAVLRDNGFDLIEIETVLGWDDPPERREEDGLRREQLAFDLADAVGARHVVAVGALTAKRGTRPPKVSPGSVTARPITAARRIGTAGLQHHHGPAVSARDRAAAARPNGGLNSASGTRRVVLGRGPNWLRLAATRSWWRKSTTAR
jgi:sugar phosphate isomerase/epimerase